MKGYTSQAAASNHPQLRRGHHPPLSAITIGIPEGPEAVSRGFELLQPTKENVGRLRTQSIRPASLLQWLTAQRQRDIGGPNK